MARTRKTPQTWIDAGLKALPKHGPDGLRAETLSRLMGTTKGSFYWHFEDVAAFQGAVLREWEEALVARFDKLIAREATPVAQLRALSGFRPSRLDQTIRGWAVQDTQAARAVARADATLTGRIASLLGELDARHPDFPGLVLAALIATPPRGSHAETLIDLLLVLK